MKAVIVIDGKSANELFAVVPKDLRNHFFPERLNVDPQDVVKIHFEELQRDGKVITPTEAWLESSEPYSVITHEDNYEREEADEP